MVSEVKPKTLAEFKAELLLELKGILEKSIEPRLKKLEAGFGELRGLYSADHETLLELVKQFNIHMQSHKGLK